MTGGKIDGVDDAVISEALAEWPSPVRSSGSWDAAAQRLLARINDPATKASVTAPAWQEAAAAILEAEAPASSDGFDADWDSEPDESAPVESVQTGPKLGPPRLGDDDLFAAPLPLETDEPEEHAPLLDLPERRSGSVSPPMAGRSDTDVASIAAEPEHAPPSVEFAPTEPALLAAPSAPVLDEVPESTLRASTRPPPTSQISQVTQAASVTPPPMAAIDALPPPSKRSPRQRAAIFGGLGVLAAAACVFAMVKTRAPQPVAAAPNVASATATAEPAPAPAAEENKIAESPSEAPAAEPVAQQAPSHPEKKPSSRPIAASKKPVASTKGTKKELTPVSNDPMMRVAATPTDSTGGVPQKPSNGAVQSALSSVLPRARACLRGDDGVSRVTLTFDSSGKVQSSSLAGPAAKKPAEACIKAALGKMKLPPFAEPKFSAIVTVRPP
ncbi:hypothetical protein LZC95_03910 [Pendulispora brunnea]|uniref:Uncharacterized protein n=1 Tax=Pendulispora brunnea TaxID=2905690 RepID=A0ABZ2KBB4_9BACT